MCWQRTDDHELLILVPEIIQPKAASRVARIAAVLEVPFQEPLASIPLYEKLVALFAQPGFFTRPLIPQPKPLQGILELAP